MQKTNLVFGFYFIFIILPGIFPLRFRKCSAGGSGFIYILLMFSKRRFYHFVLEFLVVRVFLGEGDGVYRFHFQTVRSLKANVCCELELYSTHTHIPIYKYIY